MKTLPVAGWLLGPYRRPAVLHRVRLQLPVPGRRSAEATDPGSAAGAPVPPHDAPQLPLALLHRHVQTHLPLPQLPLPGRPTPTKKKEVKGT